MFLILISLMILNCNEKNDKQNLEKTENDTEEDDNYEEYSKKTREVLLVSLSLNTPPFQGVDEDGNPYGMYVDLINDLGKFSGKKVEIVKDNKIDSLMGVNKGKYDLTIATIDERRKEMVKFSIPFIDFGASLIVRKGHIFQELNDLNNPEVKIVVKKSTTAERLARQYFPNAQIIKKLDEESVIMEVVNGNFDFTIHNMIRAYDIGKKYEDSIDVYHGLLGVRWSAFALGLEEEYEEENLIEIVNSFLSDYIDSGRMIMLENRYLGNIKEEFEKQNQIFSLEMVL